MSRKISESEKIVIREFYKNPNASISEIVNVLNEERTQWNKLNDDKRLQKKIDARSVSKFKSIAIKKIKEGLRREADINRLDYSLQGTTKEEQEQEKIRNEILAKNGILIGYDFRDDRTVYIFYTIKTGYFLWPDHICKRCWKQCYEDLRMIRREHGLSEPKKEIPIRYQFKQTIEEIIEKNKEGKKT